MKAEIITIGDEILIGQIVDTNSAWLGQKLNENGVWIEQITSISDNSLSIKNALDNSIPRSELIILTGGLGPTKDDLTKKVLADYFRTPLVRNAEVEEHLKGIFERWGRQMTEKHAEQADLPEGCTYFLNQIGTASGMMFEKDGTRILSLPGVPYEMKHLVETYLIPLLQSEKTEELYHHTIWTAGLPESVIAEMIEEEESNLPDNVKLAFLPRLGMVRLRLSAKGALGEDLSSVILPIAAKIKVILKNNFFGENDTNICAEIGKLLIAKNQKVALAESCTGGLVAHLFTSNPGSSIYFEGSVVSYSYELKMKLLQVKQQTLTETGAVSKETVSEMLEGLLELTGADYGISISGIAGPDGGTTDKPVGLVWIAVGSKEKYKVKEFRFAYDRKINIERTASAALFELWKIIAFGHA